MDLTTFVLSHYTNIMKKFSDVFLCLLHKEHRLFHIEVLLSVEQMKCRLMLFLSEILKNGKTYYDALKGDATNNKRRSTT
jgi:hypothetical protein